MFRLVRSFDPVWNLFWPVFHQISSLNEHYWIYLYSEPLWTTPEVLKDVHGDIFLPLQLESQEIPSHINTHNTFYCRYHQLYESAQLFDNKCPVCGDVNIIIMSLTLGFPIAYYTYCLHTWTLDKIQINHRTLGPHTWHIIKNEGKIYIYEILKILSTIKIMTVTSTVMVMSGQSHVIIITITTNDM